MMPVTTEEGAIVADRAAEARSFGARFRGWMLRGAIGADEALYLPDCPAIHTFLMRTAIDAVFLDGEGRILGIRAGLRPWRVASWVGAKSVLELAPGRAASAGLRPGQRLSIRGGTVL